ncbi:MAG TPA: hypothetical protein VIY08_05595 [Candidatus Nitrosocosmicus sp.]
MSILNVSTSFSLSKTACVSSEAGPLYDNSIKFSSFGLFVSSISEKLLSKELFFIFYSLLNDYSSSNDSATS